MKNLWNALCVINIITIMYLIIPFLLFLIYPNEYGNILNVFFRGNLVVFIYYPLALLTLAFWIFCIKKAIKLNKIASIILLIFLNGLFAPVFYLINYRKIHNK